MHAANHGWARRSIDASLRWLARWRGWVMTALLVAGVVLRVLLVRNAPIPVGYVWDFYTEGIRLFDANGRLPTPDECWQCSHPPLFYVAGWVFYAFGRWVSSAPGDAMALRWVGALALISASATIYYGYRLLQWFGCRGASLVTGLALLLVFPCLFISAYGPEADILLTALLSALLYYLTRYSARLRHATSSSSQLRHAAWLDLLRLGTIAGLAAATKYSGLVGLAAIGAVQARHLVTGPHRARVIRDGLVVLTICVGVGGWKYIDNYRTFGTPLYEVGSAGEGFSFGARSFSRTRYDFTSLRLADLRRTMGPMAPPGQLSSFSVYDSALTTLHAQAWSDMNVFSLPTRHGDPGDPYPRKWIPVDLTMSLIDVALVVDGLAVLGFVVTLRRRSVWPMTMFTVIGLAAYLWWLLPQPEWALKTKYILFLLPPFVFYVLAGMGWLRRRVPVLAIAAGAGVLVTVLLAHVYLYAFAVGGW